MLAAVVARIDPEDPLSALELRQMPAPDPPEGWEVFDSNYSFLVVAPEGVELGGEFAGVRVPPGTILTFGDYVIVDANQVVQVRIRFKALRPLIPHSKSGMTLIECEADSPTLGAGLAVGVGIFGGSPDGRVRASGRNTITFTAN